MLLNYGVAEHRAMRQHSKYLKVTGIYQINNVLVNNSPSGYAELIMVPG
jgi:hypothetical protein